MSAKATSTSATSPTRRSCGAGVALAVSSRNSTRRLVASGGAPQPRQPRGAAGGPAKGEPSVRARGRGERAQGQAACFHLAGTPAANASPLPDLVLPGVTEDSGLKINAKFGNSACDKVREALARQPNVSIVYVDEARAVLLLLHVHEPQRVRAHADASAQPVDRQGRVPQGACPGARGALRASACTAATWARLPASPSAACCA